MHLTCASRSGKNKQAPLFDFPVVVPYVINSIITSVSLLSSFVVNDQKRERERVGKKQQQRITKYVHISYCTPPQALQIRNAILLLTYMYNTSFKFHLVSCYPFRISQCCLYSILTKSVLRRFGSKNQRNYTPVHRQDGKDDIFEVEKFFEGGHDVDIPDVLISLVHRLKSTISKCNHDVFWVQ